MRLLLAILVLSSVCVAGRGRAADAVVSGVAGGSGKPVRVVVAAACFGDEPGAVARLGARLLARHLVAEVHRPVEVRLGATGAEWVGGGDVVMMTGDVWVRSGRRMEAVVQSRVAESTVSAWVLVVREPGDGTALSRGHVVVAGEGEGELPMMWLEGWRRSRGLVVEPTPTTHRVTREPKAAVGLLRTFFGKADACVVPERVFLEECAHNPEIGVRLTRVALSPPLPGAVVAVAMDGAASEVAALRCAVERLESTPHGTALASLLGVRGFVPFSAERWPAVAALVGGRSPVTPMAPEAVATLPHPASGRPPAP